MVATSAQRAPTIAQNMHLRALQKSALAHYKSHGRHHLPWRKTHDPYKILVSEVMLQQTQVDRVVPKYNAFIKAFPSARALAKAPLTKVLRLWSGLGYNRRAKYLHQAAKVFKTGVELEELPGVGPYTARAVRVFAFNKPEVLIETNIRAVFLHHLFPKATKVPDAKLLPLIAKVLDHKNPHMWYAALMDYGSYLKQKYPNPSRRSKHHAQQKAFKGSDREVRGAILRAHLVGKRVTGFDPKRVSALRKKLKQEGLISSQ